MKIRKARKEDLASLINLYKQLYDAEKVFDQNLKNEFDNSIKQEQTILKRINSRKEIFLVAEDNNKIIGLIDGYIIDNIHHIEKVGYLDHICIDENYRKQNLATTLIEKFSIKLKNKNVKYLKLNAFRHNIPATNLYEKLGFKEYSVYYIKEI